MFIPLHYQLVSAYQPISLRPPTSIVVPTPTGTVLGIATTTVSSPPQANTVVNEPIGGEGKMITIAVFGDSMIETFGQDMPVLKKTLQKSFPNKAFNLLNFGQSATTIDNASSKIPDIIALKPDIIIIESFAYNNFGNTQSGFDRQWQHLSNITSQIKSALPHTKIILSATVAPNSITFANGIPGLHLSSLDKIERTKTIKLYLQNIVNFATSQNYLLANVYKQSLVRNDGNPQLISSADNLHLSERGKEFFSSIVADTISQNKLIE